MQSNEVDQVTQEDSLEIERPSSLRNSQASVTKSSSLTGRETATPKNGSGPKHTKAGEGSQPNPSEPWVNEQATIICDGPISLKNIPTKKDLPLESPRILIRLINNKDSVTCCCGIGGESSYITRGLAGRLGLTILPFPPSFQQTRLIKFGFTNSSAFTTIHAGGLRLTGQSAGLTPSVTLNIMVVGSEWSTGENLVLSDRAVSKLTEAEVGLVHTHENDAVVALPTRTGNLSDIKSDIDTQSDVLWPDLPLDSDTPSSFAITPDPVFSTFVPGSASGWNANYLSSCDEVFTHFTHPTSGNGISWSADISTTDAEEVVAGGCGPASIQLDLSSSNVSSNEQPSEEFHDWHSQTVNESFAICAERLVFREPAPQREDLLSLVAELDHSQPSHMTLDDQPGISCIDGIKLAMESVTQSRWSWWPLAAPRQRLRPGEVQLVWSCVRNMLSYCVVVSPHFRSLANVIIRRVVASDARTLHPRSLAAVYLS